MKRHLLILFILATAAVAEQPKATLCHAWETSKTRPLGPTSSFLSDARAVCMVISFKEAPAKGETFTAYVVRDLGLLSPVVLTGATITADGVKTKFPSGFRLVGQAWARAGGKFRYVVKRDKTNVVAETRFTINVGRRFALLVGIADYAPKGPSKGDLPAVDQEAHGMRTLLINAFGFQSENIVVLTNLDATADRIRAELRAMADRAGENDAVFFYYAGHGTQIPDLDGDEADGWDEALCPSDLKPKLMTRPDQLRLYISDDEIAIMLARFKTKNVTIMFDSCHSGTAVRAGEDEWDIEGGMVGRSQKQGVGRKLVEQAEDARRANQKPIANGLDIDQRYVFISASRSWETAAGNKQGGFFTRNIRASMAYSDGLSWDAMVHRIRRGVHSWNPGQTPEVTGAVRRYPFTLAEAPADAPYERPTVAALAGIKSAKERTYVAKAIKGQMVVLSGRTTLGSENAGVLLDAYGSSQLASGKPKGRVRLTGRITKVLVRKGYEISGSEAEVLSGEVSRGDRLVLLAVRVPDKSPSVGRAFAARTSKSAKIKFDKLLKPMFDLLKSDPRVRLLFGVRMSSLDYLVIPRTIDGKTVVTIITPTNSVVGTVTGTSAEIAKSVQTVVSQRHANFTRFNRIANPSSEMRVRIVVEGGEGPRKGGTSIRCKGYVSEATYVYAYMADLGGPPVLRVVSNKPIAANSPFQFDIRTNKNAKGRFVIRLFASKKPLKLGNSTDSILKALQAAYPAPGGGTDFIGTQGWGETTMWLEYR